MPAFGEVELEALYERLEKPVYNVVYRWVWNPEEARDIVQDTFVRLWRMRQRVEMATVEPLVYKIALNLARSKAPPAQDHPLGGPRRGLPDASRSTGRRSRNGQEQRPSSGAGGGARTTGRAAAGDRAVRVERHEV
jgi:hypothetical protein